MKIETQSLMFLSQEISKHLISLLQYDSLTPIPTKEKENILESINYFLTQNSMELNTTNIESVLTCVEHCMEQLNHKFNWSLEINAIWEIDSF